MEILQLILLGLACVLLAVLVWIGVEAARILKRVRLVAERIEFLTDITSWFGAFSWIKRRFKKK